jgi:hypothetical protein
MHTVVCVDSVSKHGSVTGSISVAHPPPPNNRKNPTSDTANQVQTDSDAHKRLWTTISAYIWNPIAGEIWKKERENSERIQKAKEPGRETGGKMLNEYEREENIQNFSEHGG